ncbi:4Fe-4S binding protein [Rhodovastum atsumiense]|uniref:4Fe-4S binding protein n=1 Tax=Rhodovastum atsumiense TaxID=504468 RepID=A0A5M6IWW1_9PROT|nr:4Fe-4S binding protein [Rhodovastum atsumiense]KAA5612782.1 4Fe-4S binding protein [Rhodovastum atsumiense]CAH2602649.1 4Fe-4S binding protein [Rhodovastum atsumiense]
MLDARRGLADRLERFLAHHHDKFLISQFIFLIVFVSIIFVPPFLGEPALEDTRYTHWGLFANYLLWSLWFPLVLISVVFTGRSWCGIFCPMGASSEWASRYGLHRPIPSWMRWEGTPHVSFLIITILGQTTGVREHPESVMLLFGGMFACAVLFGVLFAQGKRAWCRHTCPVGLLLGLFSRLGVVQFWPKRRAPGENRYAERGMCPTMIDINRKDESRHCIECFKCVHPESGGGQKMSFRRPGMEIEQIRHYNPNVMEVAFFFIGIGTALGGFLWLVLESYQEMRQNLGVWALSHGHSWIGGTGPSWLMSVHPERGEVFNWLDFILISGYMLVWAGGTAVVLGLATLASAYLAGSKAATGTLYQRFLELGYQYAPVCLVSLIIGLGYNLFLPLGYFGDSAPDIAKEVLLAMGLLWSVHLGNRILAEQNVRGFRRVMALLPGIAGSAATGFAWWIAIFGPPGAG